MRIAPPRGAGGRRRAWLVLVSAWLLLPAAAAGVGVYLQLADPPPIEDEPYVLALPPAGAAAPADAGGSAANGAGEGNGDGQPPPEAPTLDTLQPSPAAVPLDRPAPAAPGGTRAPTASPAAPEPPAAAPAPQGAGEAPPQQAALPQAPAAPGGLAPWQLYGTPLSLPEGQPRLAVVVTGLGMAEQASEAAIRRLPAEVTLSFNPYARDLERWITLARSQGHEVMLDLPMEPANFPDFDPGPQALLTSVSPAENLARLAWVLGRGSAYVGVAGYMGSRFLATEAALQPVLAELARRDLLFLDNRSTPDSVAPRLARSLGLVFARNDRTLDERLASALAIDARLAQVERIALTDGAAIAMAQPYPVTIERLADWSRTLASRGIALAPITALAARAEPDGAPAPQSAVSSEEARP